VDGFSWNLVSEDFFLRKYVEKIQTPLKSDKHNGHITRIRMYTYDNILITLTNRNVSDKSCGKNQNTFIFNKFPPPPLKDVLFWNKKKEKK